MTKEVIACFIADDHELFSQSLAHLLAHESDNQIRCAGYTTNASDLLNLLKQTKVSVLILDIRFPGKDSTLILPQIKALYPNLKIIMLTGHNNRYYLNSCLAEGAKGYVLKTSEINVLITAIKEVCCGNTYIDPEFSQATSTTNSSQDKQKKLQSKYDLTDKEAAIALLIAEGKNNKEIAGLLFRSEDTIKTHRRNLKKKLKVRTTAELVQLVMGLQ